MESNAEYYPYANPDFANWPECDEKGKYSLITDSGNFVIRHSPSYIAWLMKSVTGEWPKRPTPGPRAPGEHDFDAKHWDEILEFNGWEKCDHGPVASDAAKGTHFIGIIANEGEFGQLIWFTGVNMSYDREAKIRYVESWEATTYKHFKRDDRTIPATNNHIVWYME